jgi:hypothetical protein
MSILDTKFAIVNSDQTAFVYIDLGVPKESPIPKKSGISDTHQGAVEIIRRIRAGCVRNAQKTRDFIDTQEKSFPGAKYADLRKEHVSASTTYIKKLEKLEKATYRIVEIITLVWPAT